MNGWSYARQEHELRHMRVVRCVKGCPAHGVRS